MTESGQLPPLEWPRQWAWPRRSPWLAVGAAACAAVALSGVFSVDVARIATFGVLALVCLGLWQNGKPAHAAPEFINAVTLTVADRLPPDSWVHFFRERRRSIATVVMFAILGLAITGLGASTWILTPVTDVNPILIRAIGTFFGLFGLFFLFAAIRTVIARTRLGSFGQRPLGIAVGEHALAIIGVANVTYIAWDDVVSVVPEQRRRGAGRESNGVMWLRAMVTDGSEPRPILFAVESSAVHPWVTYAAISRAVTDPAWRDTLGSPATQRELEAWVAAVARVKRRPH